MFLPRPADHRCPADVDVLDHLAAGAPLVDRRVEWRQVDYDQAWITNPQQGLSYTYFSGAGIATALNGPWENTRIRGEIGIPVVRHGISGFTINAQLLKLF